MEITLPVSELKAALPALAKVVPRHASLPATRMARVTRTASGAVMIQATDLESFASFTHEGEPGEPADLLVAFEPLAQAVKGCGPTERVTLLKVDGRVSLRHLLAGRQVERAMDTLEVGDWPTIPTLQEPPTTLGEPVKEGLLRAFACCSHETTRGALMGAWLDVSDPKAHYVMGTDGRHLFSANSFRIDLRESLFIPRKPFLERPEFRDDGPWSLAVQPGGGDGWLQLRSKRWSFTTRRLDHSMPHWRQVVPASRKATVLFGDKAMTFLLDILPKLPGKDEPGQPVRLEIEGGRLRVAAGDKSMPQGATLPVGDAVATGDDLAITVDRNFAVKALKWGMRELALADPFSPLVFSAPGRRLVAMPIRTESPSPSGEPTPEEPANEPPVAGEVGGTPEPEPINRLAALPVAKPEPPASKPTIRAAIDHIDGIRDTLRSAIRQFDEVVEALRVVEKERKTTDKEVEAVREKLRALQGVNF